LKIDVEHDSLGLLVDPANIKKMWQAGVRSEHYVDPLNRAVFDFSVKYWLESGMKVAPTEDVLCHEFPAFEFDESSETAQWISRKLKERYIGNELQDSLRDAARLVGDGEPEKALSQLFKETWGITQKASARSNKSNTSQNVDIRRNRYLDRSTFTGDVRGAPLGLPEIDVHTNGLMDGELAVIVGYAGTGKSHMLVHTIKSLREAGKTPYLATLELSVEDMEERLDAHQSGVGYTAIQSGKMSRGEWDRIFEAQDRYAAMGDIFIEKPRRGERSVQHIVNRARELGADCLLIDQLTGMESRGRYSEKKGSVDEIVEDLKAEISEDESNMMPCFMAVQFNRESQKLKGGNRGGGEHIALSNVITEQVDMAYGLYQTKEARMNNSMIIEIIKNRRGAPGAWLLQWALAKETAISVRETYDD
jgi:replicative DNA helicase